MFSKSKLFAAFLITAAMCVAAIAQTPTTPPPPPWQGDGGGPGDIPVEQPY